MTANERQDLAQRPIDASMVCCPAKELMDLDHVFEVHPVASETMRSFGSAIVATSAA